MHPSIRDSKLIAQLIVSKTTQPERISFRLEKMIFSCLVDF